MGGSKSSRFGLFYGAVALACGGFLGGCSQAPKEPAPVFALPLSEVVGAPAIQGQEPAPPTAAAPARQLHYVAVPPGRKIGGMAHARLILKQAAAKPHRATHPHKPKIVARPEDPGAAGASTAQAKATAKPPAGDVPAAAIRLDEPATNEPVAPAAKR